MNKVVYLDTRRRRTLPISATGLGMSGSEGAIAPRAVQVSIVMVSFHTGPALDEAIDAVLA
jgi:N-acetylglucosaminyl-diphospho-decaprenol L-rhamnosyltransferase